MKGVRNISTAGKITLQEIFVTFPINSPLIKFAILPKKIPIGETQAIISSKKKVGKPLFLENKCVPRTIPIRAPWKDIPPSQILKISNGFEI